jgi:hypothetical protein
MSTTTDIKTQALVALWESRPAAFKDLTFEEYKRKYDEGEAKETRPCGKCSILTEQCCGLIDDDGNDIWECEECCHGEGEAEDQYSSKCAECEAVLHENVAITCCVKKASQEEMVVCSNCWCDNEEEFREEGWTCDEDSDSEED